MMEDPKLTSIDDPSDAEIAENFKKTWADGYAVINGGEISVRSVSPTEVGAKVNSLVVDHFVRVTENMTVQQIEKLWQERRGTSYVARVEIAISTSP